MRLKILPALMLAVLVTVGGAGLAWAAEPAMVSKTAKGDVLTDSKGITLYVFDKDAGGQSNCNGKCAENWPPLKAEAGAAAMGKWSVITRADGSKQWAYGGKPLYTFIKDKAPGDTHGDGVNNVWWLAKP
ncbi:MAG TPA: hypothetical protein VL359_01875 [bacterium]|nr:hypothetical protein [bacterium]